MKGTYRITVQSHYLKYDLTIKRNITILKGDSATGKTTLVEMIQAYLLNGSDSGIQLTCSAPCRVIEGNTWEEQLSTIHGSIVFIDEGSRFVSSGDFARAIRETDNYYVIVTRENLDNLPYSVTEIYGIRSSGRFNRQEPVYHEMYRIYPEKNARIVTRKGLMIVEDSNAGYEFFSKVCDEYGIRCVSAGGAGKIFSMVSGNNSLDNIVIVADGAAFGSQMGRIYPVAERNPGLTMYLPESFEWILLDADILNDPEIRTVLEDPAEYIESSEYFSWERYFTSLLTDKTAGMYLSYSKNKLNEAYLKGRVYAKIRETLPEQLFAAEE